VADIESHGGQAIAVALDVSDEMSIASAIQTCESTLGGLDILVCAAGVLAFGSVLDTDPATWDQVLRINLTGTYLACRAAIPLMKQRGGGAIITIASSTGAHDAASELAAYVASKGAITMLTKAMAVDHATDGIRVNAIAPGPVVTPMLQSVMSEPQIEAFGHSLPLGRMGRPEDIASMACFLASDSASFVTGAVVAVDGGQTAQIGTTPSNL
jgi:NAD(P)-dependent dehydrogenase (short-subunit alcohol dehydrogenase family)